MPTPREVERAREFRENVHLVPPRVPSMRTRRAKELLKLVSRDCSLKNDLMRMRRMSKRDEEGYSVIRYSASRFIGEPGMMLRGAEVMKICARIISISNEHMAMRLGGDVDMMRKEMGGWWDPKEDQALYLQRAREYTPGMRADVMKKLTTTANQTRLSLDTFIKKSFEKGAGWDVDDFVGHINKSRLFTQYRRTPGMVEIRLEEGWWSQEVDMS